MQFFSTIDFHSFSSFWYWAVVVVQWSVLTFFVHGVPVNTIMRSRKHDQAREDMQALFSLYRRRFERSVPDDLSVPLGVVAFLFAMLFVMGFVLGNEMSQALIGLLAPFLFVSFINLRRIKFSYLCDIEGHKLRGFLLGTRRRIQTVGVVWLFVLTMWGTYQNLVRFMPIHF